MKFYFYLIFLLNVAIVADEPKDIPSNTPEEMVYVPAGYFIMGSKYGDPDERPQHIAHTEAYFIDKYEVSNLEYSKFDPEL